MEFILNPTYGLLLANLLILIILLVILLRQKEAVSEQLIQSIVQQSNDKILESIRENQQQLNEHLNGTFSRNQAQVFELLSSDREKQLASLENLKLTLEKRVAALDKNLSTSVSDNIRKGINDLRQDLDRSLQKQSEVVQKNITGLTESTDSRLKEISGQVEKRLSEGFEKTNQTFSDVIRRLALIDDAQKKITELSSNVVSLQEILNDKRSRGAFGEVQLQSLVSNIMPDSHYSMQYKLSNGKIADCVLSLPEPTGQIAIDAKFPMESYKKMMDVSVADVDRKQAAKQLAKDIKKHIDDIAQKYVLPPETSDGAVMFIPAESVFAEIHGHFPELVEYAYKNKVWLVSPTTLMAILTTASAVIKDEQTRKQVHIIKKHLSALGKDFVRFQERMDKLSTHIGQVSKDVDLVHVSAKKISSRFEKIERVDISQELPKETSEERLAVDFEAD